MTAKSIAWPIAGKGVGGGERGGASVLDEAADDVIEILGGAEGFPAFACLLAFSRRGRRIPPPFKASWSFTAGGLPMLMNQRRRIKGSTECVSKVHHRTFRVSTWSGSAFC